MQIPTFAALTALLAVANAAPAPVSPVQEKSPLVARTSNNLCGDSTFINQSSGGSPTVSDCRQIATNFANGGTWTITDSRVIGTYGTCAFGIMDKPTYAGVVGNQDVIDIINDSINKFTWNGLVGAKGVMSCNGVLSGTTSMTWGLYHT